MRPFTRVEELEKIVKKLEKEKEIETLNKRTEILKKKLKNTKWLLSVSRDNLMDMYTLQNYIDWMRNIILLTDNIEDIIIFLDWVEFGMVFKEDIDKLKE